MGLSEYHTGEKHEIGLKEILVAFGVVVAAGGGLAIAKKYDLGMDDISATIAYLEAHTGISSVDTQIQVQAEIPQKQLAPTPAPVQTVANGSATPVPEKPFLMYDDIKIIGDEEFQKDVVMTLEFARKYSPPDYQFIKENNKWIESTDLLKTAGAGIDGIDWGEMYLKEQIDGKHIIGAVMTAAHESGHNFAYRTNRNEYDNETYANVFAINARTNLSIAGVDESKINEFYAEFDLSKFKK